MPDLPDLLTLKGAKPRRTSASIDITFKQMRRLTGFGQDDLTALESLNPHIAREPYLDEAFVMAQVLQCDLMTLIGGTIDHMRDLDTGFDVQDDVAVWRTGVRLPLRFGIRLALRFGLANPFDLLTIKPIDRQIWSMVATGERTASLRTCPWCNHEIVGDAGHADTCLPNNLYGPRDAHISTIGTRPTPRVPHRKRLGSRKAPGLLAVRTRAALTQDQMAVSLEIARSTYYRIEKMIDPLTQELAERIAVLYKVSLLDLYTPSAPAASV